MRLLMLKATLILALLLLTCPAFGAGPTTPDADRSVPSGLREYTRVLDRVLATEVSDLVPVFADVDYLFDHLRQGFARTHDPARRAEAFREFASAAARHWADRGVTVDRESLARQIVVATRRGDLEATSRDLARSAAAARRDSLLPRQWAALTATFDAGLDRHARALPARAMPLEEFLYLIYMRPLIVAEPVGASEGGLRTEDDGPNQSPTCEGTPESCYNNCSGGFSCLDGTCDGATCCSQGSVQCDFNFGWWTCTYHYMECAASLIWWDIQMP